MHTRLIFLTTLDHKNDVKREEVAPGKDCLMSKSKHDCNRVLKTSGVLSYNNQILRSVFLSQLWQRLSFKKLDRLVVGFSTCYTYICMSLSLKAEGSHAIITEQQLEHVLVTTTGTGKGEHKWRIAAAKGEERPKLGVIVTMERTQIQIPISTPFSLFYCHPSAISTDNDPIPYP